MTTTPPNGHDSWLEKGCDWLDTIEERKAARAELAALRARLAEGCPSWACGKCNEADEVDALRARLLAEADEVDALRARLLAAEARVKELEQIVHMQTSGNMAQRLTAAREALAYERLAYERRVTAARDDLSNFNGRMDDMVKAAARKREGG